MNLNKREIIRYLFSGDSIISILIYLLIFYVLFEYLILPLIYTYSDISYISAVVSSSMSHNSPTINYTFYGWLQSHGFNMSEVSKWPFLNGIPVGSLVVAYKVPASEIKVGDVIISDADVYGKYEEVIHRVINETVINGSFYYTTKGDANPSPLPFEYNIPYNHVIGVVNTVIPYLGYPRYLLYRIGL